MMWWGRRGERGAAAVDLGAGSSEGLYFATKVK